MKKRIVKLLVAGMMLMLLVGFKEKDKESAIPITDIEIQDLDENFTLYYVDELHIIGKYMFVTCDEYYDIDSGYTDVTYHVYMADEPMDNNELVAEYYAVVFYDGAGEPHFASLSNRDWDFSEQLAEANSESYVTVSAYVSVAANYDHKEFDSHDEKVNRVRETVMNALAEENDLVYENIDMVYKGQ